MLIFWARISLAELVLLLSIATDGYAQDHTKCSKTGWENFWEGAQDDACQIAQKLMGDCTSSGNSVIVPQINISSSFPWYKATAFPEVPDCACTMTMYNILSICAACQQFDNTDNNPHSFPRVQSYTGGRCEDAFESGVLQTKPNSPNHRVHWPQLTPHWVDKMVDDPFNLENANTIVGYAPNSTSITPTTTDTTPNETESPAASTSSPSSGPNIGAIVGGVVGGLVFLGTIIALAFFLRHRKRRTRDVAPSDEFLKPEYYATPPLLSATNDRRDSEYRDDIAEEEIAPAISQRLSWAGGLVATRRTEDDEGGDMLPPFTQGTYIGPSPHEKGIPARRRTDESDATMRTTTTNTLLLSSPTRPGTSENA